MKFGRASHSLTVTLPLDVLHALRQVHLDPSRAIVEIVESRSVERTPARLPAELVGHARRAVILVEPTRLLRALQGVDLLPLSDGRALIVLEEPAGVMKLELDVRDALERDDLDARERRIAAAFARFLAASRRSRGLHLQTRTVIVLDRRLSKAAFLELEAALRDEPKRA